MMKHVVVTVFLLFALGCTEQQDALRVMSPDYYAKHLRNPQFVWKGPTSNEDRIPSLHAARALAFLGDPAVPYLLDAIEDPSIDEYSIYDALDEIGLPVDLYRCEILENRSGDGIRRWWNENAESTREQREQHRRVIGISD